MKVVNYDLNVDDKVYCRFEEGIIKEIDGDRVRDVKFIYGTIGSWSLKVVPITEETTDITKRYSRLEEDLRRYEGGMNLNWPDIINFMEYLWYSECIEALELKNKAPHERSNTTAKDLRKLFNKFSKSMMTTMAKLRKMEVCEVRIFR